jgi:hypothetical protein
MSFLPVRGRAWQFFGVSQQDAGFKAQAIFLAVPGSFKTEVKGYFNFL